MKPLLVDIILPVLSLSGVRGCVAASVGGQSAAGRAGPRRPSAPCEGMWLSVPSELWPRAHTSEPTPKIYCKQVKIFPGKISSEAVSDEAGAGLGSWSGLEMASVLSSWYGYNIHNIFNVANFIEYPDAVPAQPYPKRRKLDKANNYLVPESLAHGAQLPAVPDYHDTGARVRSHNVSYRPYSDLQQHAAAAKQKASKKSSAKSDAVVRSRVAAEEEAGEEGTTVHHLFPEILCLIFEKLDLRSKGRVAQVNISKYFMAIPIETRTHAIPIKIT